MHRRLKSKRLLSLSFIAFVTASGLATAFPLFRYSFSFFFNFLFFSLVGLTFHSVPFLRNVNPRYLLLAGLTTFVLVVFTFKNSFLSNQLLTDFITRFAAISLHLQDMQNRVWKFTQLEKLRNKENMELYLFCLNDIMYSILTIFGRTNNAEI